MLHDDRAAPGRGPRNQRVSRRESDRNDYDRNDKSQVSPRMIFIKLSLNSFYSVADKFKLAP